MRALGLLLVTSLAHAEDPHALVKQRLADGERRWIDQDYRGALEPLQLVTGDAVATVDERARAWEYLGLTWLVLGKKQKAREAFEELLAIDPQYTLSEPSRSPKLRAFFEEVRSSFVPGYPKYQRGHAPDVELNHAAPPAAQAGRPLEMAAQVSRGAAHDITLRARRQGLLTFAARPLKREEDGRFRVTYSPPRDSADYVLEYYLEARDAEGRVVARVASPERPIALPVRGLATPWFRRWYVWAAVGVVVTSVVVGVAVAESAQSAPAGSLPPGKVDLGLRF